jgi:hypothetical protein
LLIILRTPAGREFVIAELDDFDREIQVIRENRELMDFLDERSQETNTYSLAEVRRHLGFS